MPAVPFIGPSYIGRSRNANAQQTINLYPELDPTGTAKGQQAAVAALYGTPGLALFTTMPGSGGVRALFASANHRLYGARGTGWYRYTGGESWATLGTLQTSSGPVSMADNGTEVCLVDGNHGYIYNEDTAVFTQITDPSFFGSERVAYVDGYFCFTQPQTQRFYTSALLDGLTFDPLAFASAEALPDRLLTLATNQREVWLFGEESIEVWYDAGLADFPFTRIQGAVLEFGCEAVFSVATVEGDLYWLGGARGGHGRVYRQQGYQPVPISTHAVERAMEEMSTRSDAQAFGYQQEGHPFYVLTFPSAEQTWVYDISTQLWHERRSWYSDGSLRAWRPGPFASWNGRLLCGDRLDGRIYQLDLQTYTDDGNPIPRIRTTPHYSHPLLGWATHHSFQLDCETGVGLDGGVNGSAPQVALSWSDDGGHTWSNDHFAALGALGQYRTRAIWRRLGQSRDRVYRVRCNDPVKIAWLGATIATTLEAR